MTPAVGISVRKTKKKSVSDDKCIIQREVRLLKKPNWIATPWFDLIRSGQVSLVKNLPRPEEVIVPSTEKQTYRQMKPYAKRQRIEELADERFDPKTLPQELWSRIGISTLSLPGYLRPGVKPR